jgi:hypothetical protein
MHANIAANRPTVSADRDHAALVEWLNRAARREPTAVLGVLSFWLCGGVEYRPSGPAAVRPLRSPSL